MEIVATSPAAPEALALIHQLDIDLAARYPGSPIHGIDTLEFAQAGGYFLVAKEGAAFVGCGAFRPLDAERAEIKRMFVVPAFRRQGRSRTILRHLEGEIERRGFREIVLETGCNQPEAIAFYLAEGYRPIPLFSPYVDDTISRCFAKPIGA
jgi:GNAT superfamily N-acetyltransferase